MKKGAPIIPVRIPSISSAEVNVLQKISIISIKIPPKTIAIGSIFLLSEPIIIRAVCGMTRPTHPIVPDRQTELAVIKVEEIMNIPRVVCGLIPTDCASLSTSERTLSWYLKIRIITIGIKIVGSIGIMLLKETFAKEPVFVLINFCFVGIFFYGTNSSGFR